MKPSESKVERLHRFFVRVFTTYDLSDKNKRQEMKRESFELDDMFAQLESQNAALLDVVRDCVNFLADLDTKSDRAKALHKRAYTAHSKAKRE